MEKHFADRLVKAVKEKKSPLVVGLDPVYSRIPSAIKQQEDMGDARDISSCIDAIFDFCSKTLRVIAPHVPAVKINIAYFEKYLWEGIETYYALVSEAQSLGLMVIGDVKRGDIGHTAKLYAEAHLKNPEFKDMGGINTPDAITINGFAGSDGILPFADIASDNGKGVFVWCRASNPSAAVIQDVLDQDNNTMYGRLADLTGEIANQNRRLGAEGYSNIGMVVGGTAPQLVDYLRRKFPKVWFLVPGYGSQGAGAADCVRFCNSDGCGALINASRSILYAHENEEYSAKFKGNWEKCIEQAVLDANNALNAALGG